jgi:predicted transposase YbfD/YdcC
MSILERIEKIPDPRMEGKVKHNLSTILFVGLCGVLSGCESWSDIEDYCRAKRKWLSHYVDLSNGIPSGWTFRRVFILLDPTHMEALLRNHAASIVNSNSKASDQIAVDGKVFRATKRVHLQCLQSITAWCNENNLVLAEQQVGSKSNEIATIPLLLENLDLYRKTVSIDAGGCQKKIAKMIKDKKGDYLLGLKNNHPKFYQAIKEVQEKNEGYLLLDERENNHGRITRRCYFSYNAKTLPNIEQWEGAKSIMAVQAVSSKKNGSEKEQASEWRYYLSSHPFDAAKLPHYVRNHWGIENKLHWILDVHMKEDQDQKVERQSVRSFGILKRIALNIVRTGDQTPKRSMRRKLKCSGWDNEYLRRLLVAA